MANFSLHGRVAVVTGASRGLGKASARDLATAGAAVAVTARDVASLSATVDELDGLGAPRVAVALEVRERASIRSACDLIESTLGPIDVGVNNAGVQGLRPATEVSEDDWDFVLDTNLRGLFFCCQEFGRRMLPRRKGTIVNISSAAGLIPASDRVAYAASKAGVNMATRVLALEWAAYGINVNAVAPTFVETELGQQTLADPVLRKHWTERIPLGRVATVEDVSAAVVYLASPAAEFNTGVVLPDDGGLTMR